MSDKVEELAKTKMRDFLSREFVVSSTNNNLWLMIFMYGE